MFPERMCSLKGEQTSVQESAEAGGIPTENGSIGEGAAGSGGSRGVSAVSAETPFVSLLSTSQKFTEDE